jgi:CubicO group peptidase (beta-lactamase class C family)
MGWRLPGRDQPELTSREFVRGIKSGDPVNRTGLVQYKSANTDVIGEIVERVSGRSLRHLLIDIVEGAGLAGTFHIGTDREGTPIVNGGACVTARDLARYALLFVRGGRGVGGQVVWWGVAPSSRRRGHGPACPTPRPATGRATAITR